MSEVEKLKGGKEEKIFWNLVCNLLIPTVLLTQGNRWYEWLANRLWGLTGWDGEGLELVLSYKIPVVLVVALLFPVGYGVYDLVRRRKWNLFSLIGILNVGLTGVVGLFGLDSFWIAVKEAGVPFIFALAILLSMKTKTPLVRALFLNEKVMRRDVIARALEERGKEGEFERLEREVTWILAGSFLLSTVLNFVLARIIVTSEGGSEAFNAEIGRLTALSWPVIVVPCMILTVIALWRLFSQLGKLTGLPLEEMMQDGKKPSASASEG